MVLTAYAMSPRRRPPPAAAAVVVVVPEYGDCGTRRAGSGRGVGGQR
ncbi:hypothetical protein [Arthrobacter sp. zg-Y769]|nr:hypothetical protein [Arthrobacter sp. zg-Y769]MCC9203577.1 hypothetical protein [Arthrobacter sp. zg-Y769]